MIGNKVNGIRKSLNPRMGGYASSQGIVRIAKSNLMTSRPCVSVHREMDGLRSSLNELQFRKGRFHLFLRNDWYGEIEFRD